MRCAFCLTVLPEDATIEICAICGQSLADSDGNPDVETKEVE